MREAMAGPGSDPRVWLALARVDDADEAQRWDPEFGWLVDVTFVSGELAGEDGIPCRVARSYVGVEEGRIDPPVPNSLVLVAVVDGDPNVEPTIVGALYSAGDFDPPATINGEDVTATVAEAFHLFRTSKGIRWQVDGDAFLEVGGVLYLADPNATQSFVRGDDQQAALDDFFALLNTWGAEVATGITGAGGTAPPSQAAFIEGIATLRLELQQALSSKIKGE